MTALTVRGILPSVIPAVLQGCHECLNPAKVLVVPAVFFCQQGVDRMMKVIRPLRVDAVASLNAIPQQTRIVQVALGDELHLAPKALG